MKLTGVMLTIALGASITTTALAQEDGSEIVLPLEAQTCNLPAAPARIPDEATLDDLKKAKANIGDFQSALTSYRDCLTKSAESEGLTEGNHIALNQAHNYSVEMEERVAEQFNVAIRAYKERQGTGGQ